MARRPGAQRTHQPRRRRCHNRRARRSRARGRAVGWRHESGDEVQLLDHLELLGTLPSTSLPQVVTNSKLCPLTGLPAPSGNAPQRPALAVKIGNDPASRPQSGLDQADIVYEEMAEGGITRYMAVFQCQNAPLIGPVRSVRWDDWNILEPYRQAILAYSGGINPWMQEAATLPWIYNANGSFDPTANAYYRYNSSSPPASLGAPYNYYTSTKALWGLFPNAKTLPPRLFKFSKTPPAGNTIARIVSIPFSSASPVVWQWSRADNQWLRFYDTKPDVDPAGTPAPHDERRDPSCEDQVRALQRERAGQP